MSDVSDDTNGYTWNAYVYLRFHTHLYLKSNLYNVFEVCFVFVSNSVLNSITFLIV